MVSAKHGVVSLRSAANAAAAVTIRSLLILCCKPYIPHLCCMACAKRGVYSVRSATNEAVIRSL